MKNGQPKYVVAWKAKNDSCLLVSLSGSKVGMDEGWYLFVYDDEMQEAILAGPCATALEALISQSDARAKP
jgi:hypothetical protein